MSDKIVLLSLLVKQLNGINPLSLWFVLLTFVMVTGSSLLIVSNSQWGRSNYKPSRGQTPPSKM